MKKGVLIIMFMLLTFCGCHRTPKGQVGAVFSPGYTDGCLLNTRIYDSVKEVSSTYWVSSSDYAFLNNCLTQTRKDAKQKVISPYIFIKLDGVLYVLGSNRVVLNPNRSLEKVSCHFLMTAIRKIALYMLDS